VTFGEDAATSRTGRGPVNLACRALWVPKTCATWADASSGRR
jgi:hypothetical protein